MVTHVRRVGAYVAAGALVVGLVLPSGALHAGLGGDNVTKTSTRAAVAVACIEFDCTMVPSPSVIEAVGDGKIWNVRWNTGEAKTRVYFSYDPIVTTVVRVVPTSAVSANNCVQLDGNKRDSNGDSAFVTLTGTTVTLN